MSGLGITLFILIAVVAAIAKFGKRPSGGSSGFAGKFNVIGVGCIGGTALIVIIFFYFMMLLYNTVKEGTDAIKEQLNNPQPPAAPAAPPKPPGERLVPYKFGGDGCVTVTDLRGNWSCYAIGGKIKFTDLNPDSGRYGQVVWRTYPGSDRTPSLPDGNYQVCRDDDPAATGVHFLMEY